MIDLAEKGDFMSAIEVASRLKEIEPRLSNMLEKNIEIYKLIKARKAHESESSHFNLLDSNKNSETKPLLTIVTPCYKTKLYYLERLNYCMLKYCDTIEWIVINDSPECGYIDSFFAECSKKYKWLKYIKNNKNLGIFKSYKKAMLESSSPYVGILDHDDELGLDKVIEALITHGEKYDIIYTNELKFNEKNIEIYEKPNFDRLSSIYYFYTHHITLFRSKICKEILGEKKPINFKTCFDIWLSFRYNLYFKSNKIKSLRIPDVSYSWRVHSGSTASSLDQKPEAKIERLEMAEEIIFENCKSTKVHYDIEVPYVLQFHSGITEKYFNNGEFTLNGKIHVKEKNINDLFLPVSASDLPLIKMFSKLPTHWLEWLIYDVCGLISRYEFKKFDFINHKLYSHPINVPFMVDIESYCEKNKMKVVESMRYLLEKSKLKPSTVPINEVAKNLTQIIVLDF